jgi:hypothetical protein
VNTYSGQAAHAAGVLAISVADRAGRQVGDFIKLLWLRWGDVDYNGLWLL